MNFLDEKLPGAFWARVQPEPNSGCWFWTGAQYNTGYGKLTRGKRYKLAHRVAFVALVGEHDERLELDHLCRNKLCCNPAHLEPVTHGENVRRGQRERVLKRTTCPSGHVYDMFFATHRRCSICNTAAKRRYKERKRAA